MANKRTSAKPRKPARQQPPSDRGLLKEAAGSWLEGPPRAARTGYPGDRVGLPESGRGSVAGQGAKLGAFVIDIVIAGIIGFVATTPHSQHDQYVTNLVSDGIFVLVTAALLTLSGRTLGMRVLGLQVVRLDGRRVGWRSLPRQLLCALLIPALITDRDHRGLHDKVVSTAVVLVR
ncbi:MAG TPA: RDD family protein [Mycobacteriales bacterium]